MADAADRRVYLTSVATVGAQSKDLRGQVDRVLPMEPHVAVIFIGANDVTHAVPVRTSVRNLTAQIRITDLSNGVYELLLTRGITEYLLRNALHQAGRGPEVSMTALLDFTVWEAFWVSTLWASVILLAGLWTLRTFASHHTSPTAVEHPRLTSDLD